MAERNLNLNIIPVDEALSRYLSALDGLLVPKFEVIPVEKSLGRITAKEVCACLNSPHYNAAAMDGIAVKAGDFNSNYDCVTDYVNVNTGDPVQEPFDAVIMAEDLPYTGEKNVLPGQHVRHVGESIKIGEEILSAKHKIRPADIGMLISAGVYQINVYSKPKIAVIPTGSELIDTTLLHEGYVPEAGKIIESNSHMYEAQIKQAGGESKRFSPIPDNFNLLKDSITKAAQGFDIVLINAGSSAGTEDFTVKVLREIGEVIVHGVAMKPGKPTVLAIVNGKPVIGTPGYPVSAFLSFETFALPVFAVLAGYEIKPRKKTEAVLSEKITSTLKQREYIRVKLENVNDKLTAFPLVRSSGVAMSLVKADGFCIADIGCEHIEAGETVFIELIEQ